MSDDVKDLLDRAAADSLRGIHLDLPTADDVGRSDTSSTAPLAGAASVQEAQLIPLDPGHRRARWPLGLAAAVLALLAIGGGLLAVRSTDDASPATPTTTVPTGDPRQRLLAAIDASVAEVFEVHYERMMEDRHQAAIGGAEAGSVHDGALSGTYVKGTAGPPSVTRIVDGMTTYYRTGPDEWVATAEGGGSNPLLEFRQGAETACVFDGNGTIVVALDQQPPCGSTSGIQSEVTLDSAGRVASIGSGDGNGSLAMVRFEYSDRDRIRLPDPSLVTQRPNAIGRSVDPATGYWTIQELDSTGIGPTTTLVGEVGPTTTSMSKVGGP